MFPTAFVLQAIANSNVITKYMGLCYSYVVLQYRLIRDLFYWVILGEIEVRVYMGFESFKRVLVPPL